jgi:hypothetical protein
VVIGCPTYAGKLYALDAWAAAVSAQDYSGPFRALMVDNTSGTETYTREIERRGIAAAHIEPSATWNETFLRSWR